MTDICLAGVVFVVPLCMGGNNALGALLLSSLAMLATVAWCVRQCCVNIPQVRWTGVEWLLLLAIAIPAIQCCPLPVELLQQISPRLSGYLSFLTGDAASIAGLQAWTTISVVPSITLSTVGFAVAAVSLFWVVVQRLETTDDVERLVRWIATAATGMAAFGLVQYFTNNGKFFWFYEHPFGVTSDNVKGSFANRNHFAHFLALGLGPLIWCVREALQTRLGGKAVKSAKIQTSRETAIGITVLSLGIVVFAGLLSLSRGGALALFAAGFVSVTLLHRSRLLSLRFVIGLGGMGVVLSALLLIHGQQSVSERLDDFFSNDVNELDGGQGRRKIWSAVLAGYLEFPILGTGAGSHREVYPLYLSGEMPGTEYSHAESGVLQVMLETGTVGIALVGVAFVFCAYWCCRSLRPGGSREAACAAVLGGSLSASLAHSFADFVWYMPGILALTILIAACCCRLRQLAFAAHCGPWPACGTSRWVCGLAATGYLALSGWMLPPAIQNCVAEHHWNNYVRFSKIRSATGTPDELVKDDLQSMIAELDQSLAAQPRQPRGQLRLAQLYVLQFDALQQQTDNPMSLEQVRDAALSSQFESRKALFDWLQRAVGEHCLLLAKAMHHAREAAQLCPLQGEAYLTLSQLAFLEGADGDITFELLEQAARVRPHDGSVLYSVGKEYFVKQDYEPAFVYWKRSFECSSNDRLRLVELLAGEINPEVFLQIFPCDANALEFLINRYRVLERPDDANAVIPRLIAMLVESAPKLPPLKSATVWLQIHHWCNQVAASTKAAAALQRALKFDPNNYDIRRTAGVWLFEQRDFKNAAKHLTWCSQRQPDDEHLRNLARQAASAVQLSTRSTGSDRQ